MRLARRNPNPLPATPTAICFGKGSRPASTLSPISSMVSDLVEDSQITAGLTASVTSVTNRDLAQFVVAVSDNTAANVLIDRVGMENVNATLRTFRLKKTSLRRKMMDIAAARRGDENVSTPREMARLLEMIYRGKALNKNLTEELLKQLKTLKKDSYLSYELP